MLNRLRLLLLLLPLVLFGAAAQARAGAAPFDLNGPGIRVAVTHGGVTLPIEWVPNLAEGDRVSIKLDLPEGQRARYRLIAAFLRGATDRPPRSWFFDARTWEKKGNDLSLVVPRGAEQLVLFLMPEDGGDVDAIVDTVRKQPGTFVRATQELNQASLDRARLETFLSRIRQLEREEPAGIAAASQALTRSLAIKLNAECLLQPAEFQATCLTRDRETLLLADTHTSALASTLAGAPTDLAFQLSATPEAGYGYYSPYIGVVRDVIRLFGAFQSTQLRYIPALARASDDRVTLLLNAPLSFGKPVSVMVAALPAIEPPKPPPLRNAEPGRPLCAAPGLVLPVEGAPLVYATRYARNTVLRLTRTDGSKVDVPVHADAGRGGFVVSGGDFPLDRLGAMVEARLHGDWGFTPFEGPVFTLANLAAGEWRPAEGEGSVVVGRENALTLRGGAAGCLDRVELRQTDGSLQAVKWERAGDDLVRLTLPLEGARPGKLSLLLYGRGQKQPQAIPLQALEEAGRIDGFRFHAGDSSGMLIGTRLDQVVVLKVGEVMFRPGELVRADKVDHLTVLADSSLAAALPAGQDLTAAITLSGGRRRQLPFTVAPPRPAAELIRVTAERPPRQDLVGIALPGPGVIPQDARLTFSFRLAGGADLTGREVIEVATADGRAATRIAAGRGYELQDARVGLVSLAPREALGPAAFGDLRFRVGRGDAAGDWVPLATLVRMPELTAAECSKDGCMLVGARLFLIQAVASSEDFAGAVIVPDGFTATRLNAPPAAHGRLFVRLRDDPKVVGSVSIP